MFVNFLPKQSVGSVFRVLLLVGCLTPSVAKAGFDWTPPAAAPSVQPAPVVQDAAPSGPLTPEPDALPVPVGHVESAPVQHNEPLVVDNKKPTSAPVVESTPVPLPVPEPTPVPTAKATPAPVAVTAPVADDVVEGFGKDIPLAIALRDIAPTKYAYSFSPSDVAGAKISWRGGKPWQDVLKDALTPLDLDMAVTESTIVIFAKQYKASENSVVEPAPSAPAAAPVAPPTMVAKRPETAPAPVATEEPLPLVATQDATVEPAPTEARRPMAAMDMKASRKWQARPGTTLRQTLEAWTKDSNVELNWSTPYDYPINNAFYFEGEFPQALDSLLSSYGGENPSPKGRLYPNLPEGPSVLMIN